MQQDTSEALTSNADQPSKAKRIMSKTVMVLVAVWLLLTFGFGMLELIFAWLPTETLAEILDGGEAEASSFAIHRSHFMAIGIISGAVVLSILVQLRKPERRLAPMLLLVGAAIAGAIFFGLSGTLSDWLLEEIVFVAVPIGLAVLVHPGRNQLFTRPTFDRTIAGMAGLASIAWLVFIVDNAWNQFQNVAGDTHAEMEHWGIAALMGTIITLAAFLGSSDKTGWRLTGWIAAIGSMLFGVHSLVFPGLASALPAFWAVAAVIWGIGFVAMIIRRGKKEQVATATLEPSAHA